MDDRIDIDDLRRRAREQLDRRLPPRTRWVQEFERCLRAELLPRAELFLAIMAAAGNPGLADQHDRSALERGWIIGFVRENPAPGWATHSLILAPGRLGLQVAFGDAMTQSAAIASVLPEESVISSGEVEQPSALGEVAIAQFTDGGLATDAETAARKFAARCDRRMLALLCSHGLTFPDRDLADVEWDAYEAALIVKEERWRRDKQRPLMSLQQFAQWMEGKLTEEGLDAPSLTGTEFAQALALTAIEPERRMRRNWRKQLVDDGEKGWKVGQTSTNDLETSSTIVLTYIRRDGSGFQETTHLSYSSATISTVEFAPDHVYEASVYGDYLTTRRFYAERGMTS